MAEVRLDLSKVTFEDVLDPKTVAPVLPAKKDDDVVIPPKKDDPIIPDNSNPNGDKGDEGGDETFYEQMGKITGYEIDGEFDESVEGVAEYAKAVGQKIAEEEVKDLFESFPDVKEYLQFRLNNGDPAKYFESKYGDVDYSKYNVTEEDVTTQETVVRKYLIQEGYKNEQIEEIVKDYRDTGLLYKQAKRFSERLVESQKGKREQLITKQAETARLQEEEREQVIAEISSTVDKGSLHNLMIPEKDRKEFRAWLLQPDGRGQTKRQAAMRELSLEKKLELEYLVFKGFDLKDLVRKEATQTKIDFLKKSAVSKGSKLFGSGQTKTPVTNKLDGLKISDIL